MSAWIQIVEKDSISHPELAMVSDDVSGPSVADLFIKPERHTVLRAVINNQNPHTGS